MGLPRGLTTPALVVDLEVLERNLRAMADHAAGRGVALRPHAKTHKCLEIARRQLALGAAGLSVATVGEAEVFASGGVEDLFIAYPLWAGDGRRQRLERLARGARLLVGVDSPAGAAALGKVDAGRPLEVLVEIDCGHHRSGVRPEEAPGVAGAASRAGLSVAGVFTFPGHGYAPGAAASAAADEAAALDSAAAWLERAGFRAAVRSGGSTPTARHAAGGGVSELRPGVYAFNDAQQVQLGSCGAEDVALAAAATVVSVPAPDRFVLDAGSKVLGADRPPWMPGHGVLPEHPGATVRGLWEHHAVVALDPAGGGRLPAVGEVVAVVPNHVCTAVNLADELVVVRDGEVVDRWLVAARGRNR
jgi:D-serine deaminase-like pyridoxal phosphate-dependent protein